MKWLKEKDERVDFEKVYENEEKAKTMSGVLIYPYNTFGKNKTEITFSQHQHRASWIGKENQMTFYFVNKKNLTQTLKDAFVYYREEMYQQANLEFQKIDFTKKNYTDEEKYFTLFFYGLSLIQSSPSSHSDLIESNLVRASAIHPFRAEPLMHLSNYFYYFLKDCKKTYFYSKISIDFQVPRDDPFFNEQAYYMSPHNHLCTCSFSLGDIELGRYACQKCVDWRPDDQRLKDNLEFYLKNL